MTAAFDAEGRRLPAPRWGKAARWREIRRRYAGETLARSGAGPAMLRFRLDSTA